MSETKLCKDCKHLRVANNSNHMYAKCHAPSQYTTSIVTGERIYAPKFSFCTIQRISDDMHTCGESARWFEQKEADKSPWWRFW